MQLNEYPNTPDGHSAAANHVFNGSDGVLVAVLEKVLSHLDVGVTQEMADPARRTAIAIRSSQLPQRSLLPLVNLIKVTYKFYSNDGLSTPLPVQVLIDAISAFVCEASNMELRPKVQPSFQPTPLKTNSSSHMQLSNSHATIDPMLEIELSDHLWTSDHSFFDQFFPKIDGIPLPDEFPTSPTEHSVCQWFMDYQERLASLFKPLSKTTWATSGQRPLCQQESSLKPDLFTYHNHDDHNHDVNVNESESAKYSWSRVVVVGELKQRTIAMRDLNKSLIVQLANYQRQVFAHQPGRRFAHGFTLVNDKMRCWVFTRSGGVVSPRLTLTDPNDLNIFCRVFYGYLHNSDLGLFGHDNPSLATLDVGGKVYKLGESIINRPAIVSRGTACWTTANNGLVLKNAWRYSERTSEGDLLQQATEKNVKGIAVYVGHMDGECVQDIFKNVQIKEVIPFNKGVKRTAQESSQSTTKRPKVSKSSQYPSRSLGVGSLGSELVPIPVIAGIPNRVQTWLVTHRGYPITDYDKNALVLLRSMRDAIRGHRSLLTDGGILHRDISINNIMMTVDPLSSCKDTQAPRKDGFHGFLIDLDLAIYIDRRNNSGAPERIGTYEFLSIDLLNGAADHCFYDDLQSFFFVMLWLVYDHEHGKELQAWSASEKVAANQKKVQAGYQSDFNKVLEGFKQMDGLSEVQKLLTEFRALLWPQSVRLPEIEREDLERLKDNLYDGIDKAFKEGISKLELVSAPPI